MLAFGCFERLAAAAAAAACDKEDDDAEAAQDGHEASITRILC